MYTINDKVRLDGRAGHGKHEYQNDFRKDYARLIHAPSFRRLQNKTQLFPGLESDFFRNRLTHSIEVAQIAGGIAQFFNTTQPQLQGVDRSLDIDLVQFAAAAHDLGHPPFGHNGERALDDMMKKFGGFEGNAQTLRILTRIEKRLKFTGEQLDGAGEFARKHADAHGRLGLNLTMRALASVLKYDAEIPPVRENSDALEKGYYSSEAAIVRSIKNSVAPNWPGEKKFKTIECQIMDVADDIAYSTYDLEDTLKGGFLSPTQIIREVSTNPKMVEDIAKKAHKALLEDGVKAPKAVTKEEITSCIADLFFSNSWETSDYLENYTIDRTYVDDG